MGVSQVGLRVGEPCPVRIGRGDVIGGAEPALWKTGGHPQPGPVSPQLSHQRRQVSVGFVIISTGLGWRCAFEPTIQSSEWGWGQIYESKKRLYTEGSRNLMQREN